MHPHRSAAAESSRGKMRAITGKGGGGSPHLGMSPFKKADHDGVTKSYHSHAKQFSRASEGYAHGGKVKARADRKAKGGKAYGSKAKPGLLGPIPEKAPAFSGSGLERGGLPRLRRPGGLSGEESQIPISKEEGKALYRRMAGSAYAHQTPTDKKWQLEEARHYAGGQGAGSEEPFKRGGAKKHAKGGKVKAGLLPRPAEAPPFSGSGLRRGGKPEHHAGGGRAGRRGKVKGNVTVNIIQPHHGGHPGLGGMGAPPIAAPPPAAMGPPPAPPPGGAAPGQPPNPQAMQALGAIAGGGGPMGSAGGMPGLGRAHGGRTSGSGLTSNMGHWKSYASKNRPPDKGGTGMASELSLAMPVSKAAKRAAGGRTGHRPVSPLSLAAQPDAGAATGVNRKELTHIQRRVR